MQSGVGLVRHGVGLVRHGVSPVRWGRDGDRQPDLAPERLPCRGRQPHHEPPEVATPPPVLADGALPPLRPDDPDESDELDDPVLEEPVPDEPDEPEELELPELPEVAALAWLLPGRTSATRPAVTALTAATPAVTARTADLPRLRSAIAAAIVSRFMLPACGSGFGTCWGKLLRPL
jgi:hypothetical protein